jgi:hypothetical protein
MIGAGLGQLYRRASAPEVSIDVVLKAHASTVEVDSVWTTVLGRPGRRPSEHALLKEFSGVSAARPDGESPVLQARFWNDVSAQERDSVMALIRQSHLVRSVRLTHAPHVTTTP